MLLWKGFGKKTQDNVIESIEFYLEQQGNFLYAQVEQLALDMQSLLQKIFDTDKIKITGAFARQSETVDELEFVIALPEKNIIEKISSIPEFEFIENASNYYLYKFNNGIKIKLYPSGEKTFLKRCFETSVTDQFLNAFNQHVENFEANKNTQRDD